MDDNKMHGKIFKQMREGRGVKLKDAAGDAISVRTLIRLLVYLVILRDLR